MQPRIQLQSTFTLNLACNPYRPTSMFAGHSCAKAWYGCTVMAAWQPQNNTYIQIKIFLSSSANIVSDLCAIVCLPLLTILFPQELQTRILLALQDAFLRSTICILWLLCRCTTSLQVGTKPPFYHGGFRFSMQLASMKHGRNNILGRGIQLICTIKQASRDSKSKKPPQDELTALIDTNGSISQRYSTTRSIQPTGTDLEVL